MPSRRKQQAIRAYKRSVWRLLRKYGWGPLHDETEAAVLTGSFGPSCPVRPAGPLRPVRPVRPRPARPVGLARPVSVVCVCVCVTGSFGSSCPVRPAGPLRPVRPVRRVRPIRPANPVHLRNGVVLTPEWFAHSGLL